MRPALGGDARKTFLGAPNEKRGSPREKSGGGTIWERRQREKKTGPTLNSPDGVKPHHKKKSKKNVQGKEMNTTTPKPRRRPRGNYISTGTDTSQKKRPYCLSAGNTKKGDSIGPQNRNFRKEGDSKRPEKETESGSSHGNGQR